MNNQQQQIDFLKALTTCPVVELQQAATECLTRFYNDKDLCLDEVFDVLYTSKDLC